VKTDPQAAQELLEKAGFSKRGAAWFTRTENHSPFA